jgi:hypothetical protein
MGGTKGRTTTPMAAADAATSTVVKRVSRPLLTMAFQTAWRAAAKRMTQKTSSDIATGSVTGGRP